MRQTSPAPSVSTRSLAVACSVSKSSSSSGVGNSGRWPAMYSSSNELIGRYGLTPDDREDLEQEMALDLLLRLPKFDPERACLNTFIARVVERRVSTIIRHRTAAKRDCRSHVCSLDEPIPGVEGCSTRHDMISQGDCDLRVGRYGRSEVERLDLRIDVSLVLAGLPPELRALAERLCTHSVTEIARELGVPRSTLYETGIARLRKAFEDKGLDEYL